MVHTRITAAVKWACAVSALAFPPLRDASAAGLDAQRIVAERSVAVLPPELRELYLPRLADLQERTIEPEAVWENGAQKRGRASWHHLRLDAFAKKSNTSARLAAADTFPRSESEARKMFKGLGLSKEGGRLPWAVHDLCAELSAAFQNADPDQVLAVSGYVMHFAWDAAQPFSGSVDHDGRRAGNLVFGKGEVGDPWYPHHSVEQRVVGELVRRNRNRYRESVQVLPMDLKPVAEPVDETLRQMTSALARLDDLLETDRQLLTLLAVSDAEGFGRRQDEYYQLLDQRCGEVVIERMQVAALLAANLITGAWERAGKPVLRGDERQTADAAGATPGGAPGAAKPQPQPAMGGAGPSGASAAGGYVGSGKSAVFHRPDCEHAKKIAGSNLVTYASAEEALSQGKRACRVCNPK